ncbi:hypothetical protein ERHA55_20400 [Erwinia rhapontici]|nr:hypothetical protein ERHA55_20400 [Erwinia rhapontici]
MTRTPQLILLAMPSIHAGAWRYPGAIPSFTAALNI